MKPFAPGLCEDLPLGHPYRAARFCYTMGEDAAPPADSETKAILKGDPFGGLGSYQAVMEFEWYRPLVLGDTCKLLLLFEEALQPALGHRRG